MLLTDIIIPSINLGEIGCQFGRICKSISPKLLSKFAQITNRNISYDNISNWYFTNLEYLFIKLLIYNKSMSATLYIMMKIYKYIILVAVVLMGITACSDENFSSSPSLKLTFSTDTISFDTIFSKVPSSTRTMWVYNKSGNGLRCNNIRLLNGNQTGYRVNVDGIYLSSSTGYMTQNVEIRNNDSIRVFVELTSPQNGLLEPRRLQDKLLFTLESGNVQEVLLDAYSWDAEEVNNLVVSENTVLESKSPLLVNGMIKVEKGAVLTIEAGQTIYFNSNAGIEVAGTLILKGTPEKNVTLRGARLDNMFDYLPYDLVSGQWKGIHFLETSYDNKIEYADIHSTMDAIVCDSSDISKTKLDIENSIIHNCQGYGVKSIYSSININNSQITNTQKDCVAIFGGNANVANSTLAQFYPFDSKRGAALRFANILNKKSLPLHSMQCVNSIVTGYAEDVLKGEYDKTENTFNYMFTNCILRTPEIKDEETAKYFVDIIWENVEDTVSGGEKNFKLVDINTQHYDFHLSERSKAIDASNVSFATKKDRDGNPRDEKPDIGCYEFRKE